MELGDLSWPCSQSGFACSTRSFPADGGTKEAGSCRRQSVISCLNQSRGHLGSWNSAFRMEDVLSKQAFCPGSNLFSCFPRQSSILGSVYPLKVSVAVHLGEVSIVWFYTLPLHYGDWGAPAVPFPGLPPKMAALPPEMR